MGIGEFVLRVEVLDWLAASEDDLRTAQVLFEQNVYYACAFYCQQSAEKALKAAYISHFKKANVLHNLIALCEELQAPNEIQRACKRLNPHYVQTRYPDAANALPSQAYDKPLAQELLEHANKVLEWSKKKISE